MNDQQKWDCRYLELAKLVSSWSKDPSTKCGAVIVNDANEIVSIGFNGLPRGLDDSETRLTDRNLKYKMIVHAERNAILFARQSLKNCTLYTWPMQSCSECAAMMIQAGIKRHVSVKSDNARWLESFEITKQMFNEADIDLVIYGEPHEN